MENAGHVGLSLDALTFTPALSRLTANDWTRKV
jgi:hypothetical protein